MVAVFLKDLRIIFRDRWALLFFILVPIVVISMVLGGLFPVGMLPEPVQWIAQVLPLTRVVDLLWLGLTGATRDGTTAGEWAATGGIPATLLVLTAWVIAGAVASRRFMRWEPRT